MKLGMIFRQITLLFFCLYVITLGVNPLLSGASPAVAEELVIVTSSSDNGSFSAQGQYVEKTETLVRLVCRRLGITPVFQDFPFARALEATRRGSVDCIVNVFRTPEREEYLYYPDKELLFSEMVLFTSPNAPVRASRLEDIKGHRVGAVRGFYYGEGVLESLMPNVMYLKDSDILYGMLLAGRFDYVLGNRSTGELYFQKHGASLGYEKAFLINRFPRFVVFSKKMGERGQELAHLFADEIERILEERGIR